MCDNKQGMTWANNTRHVLKLLRETYTNTGNKVRGGKPEVGKTVPSPRKSWGSTHRAAQEDVHPGKTAQKDGGTQAEPVSTGKTEDGRGVGGPEWAIFLITFVIFFHRMWNKSECRPASALAAKGTCTVCTWDGLTFSPFCWKWCYSKGQFMLCMTSRVARPPEFWAFILSATLRQCRAASMVTSLSQQNLNKVVK